MAKNSDLYIHAASELRARGLIGTGNPTPNTLPFAVLEAIDQLESQSVKGLVPRHVIDLVTKLLSFTPLTPLTGDDKEWIYKSGLGTVNKRCPRVVKDENGQAFDTEAVLYEYEDGHRQFNPGSRQPVTFPYMPVTRIEKI